MFFLALFSFALAAEDDISSKYSYSAIVSNEIGRGDDYQLYWSVDKEKETISFAVRVRTTGWVGLGISPTGDMVNSDVVIGWGRPCFMQVYVFIPYYYGFTRLQCFPSSRSIFPFFINAAISPKPKELQTRDTHFWNQQGFLHLYVWLLSHHVIVTLKLI